MEELNIGSRHTVVDWENFIRDICMQYLNDVQQPIGGIDPVTFQPIAVEIDESLFMQRKYHRGGHREKRWVFGGVERENPENLFLVELPMVANQPQRDANTLIPLIQQWISPGSHIYSDGWLPYQRIPNLPQGYLHDVIVHQHNFVDPNDRSVHTQTIEGGVWAVLKNKFRNMRGTSDDLFGSYLAEFVFRRRFPNTFAELLFWIRHYYPV